MDIYAVRKIKTKNPVGLFWTRKVEDLFWIINEVENPFECEYQKVSWNGGALFNGEDVVISKLKPEYVARFTQNIYDYLDSGMDILSWNPVPTRQWDNFWE